MKTMGLAAASSPSCSLSRRLPAAAQHQHHPAAPAAPPRSDSVYELSASLVDQDGQKVGLDLFRGHPVLISMFYSTCRDACPLLIADLHRIERELPASTRADLRVVLVSLDPEHDTPEALLALARAHGLDMIALAAPAGAGRHGPGSRGRARHSLPSPARRRVQSLLGDHPARSVPASSSPRVEGLGQPVDALRERLQAGR